MAIEEIIFINTNGEEISVSNLVNQMIDFYDLKLEFGETKITDFSEGSEIRNLLEAFAICEYARLEEENENTRIAFISTSYGGWLDKIGELPFINLPRVTGEYAQGEVTFSLAEAQNEDFMIPADTIVACSSTGLDFVTTTDCIIPPGELTGDASVECLTLGDDGNVSAGSIDTIFNGSFNSELLSVINSSALEGGADEEDDELYRERLLENAQADGFGTIGWYEHLCNQVKGVHDVLLINDENYTRKVLINGDVKPTPSPVLLDVLTELTKPNNHVLNHTFTVDQPVYDEHSLQIKIVVNSNSNLETTLLDSVMNGLFNGGEVAEMDFEGLNINQTLSKNEIINTLLVFDDIIDVVSIQEDDEDVDILTPSNNGVLRLSEVEWIQIEG